MRKYVLGFMFSEDGSKVSVILKNKPEWQAGKINGIGGKIEKGEQPRMAMVREFEEETGVRVDRGAWKKCGTMYGKDWTVHCFACTGDLAQLKTTTDETILIMNVRSLLMDMSTIPNLLWIVPMCWHHMRVEAVTFNIHYPDHE